MKNKIYNITCILFGIMMIIFGANKFFNFIPVPEMSTEQKEVFNAFLKIGWLMPLVAIIEIVGGILFLFSRKRALAALMMLPIIVGILAHHVHHDPSSIGIAVFFAGIELWVLLENRKKYTQLF